MIWFFLACIRMPPLDTNATTEDLGVSIVLEFDIASDPVPVAPSNDHSDYPATNRKIEIVDWCRIEGLQDPDTRAVHHTSCPEVLLAEGTAGFPAHGLCPLRLPSLRQ